LTVTDRSLAGIVRLLAIDVLPSKSVPLQLATRQPVAGLAVRLIDAPAMYWSDGQPVELGGLATGLLPEPVCVRISV
jgi:hypothetical protein